ncbi:hypothetical protein ACH4SP_27955 [Streptomyces sp. NPDC021093]|uniref:hypothetical protein n=1 Tax=Streptomyces sp. NPDC021093 TaxID=3365112 RepID=UPI0037AB5A59
MARSRKRVHEQTALVTVFLVRHGLAHLPVWWASSAGSARSSAPFDPRHSWAFAVAELPQARAGQASVLLAGAVAVLYVAAGAAVVAQADAWPAVAVAAAAAGLALKALWFHAWLSFGVLLDLGVIAAVTMNCPGSLH